MQIGQLLRVASAAAAVAACSYAWDAIDPRLGDGAGSAGRATAAGAAGFGPPAGSAGSSATGGFTPNGSGDCLQVWYEGGIGWDDARCNYVAPYVCERFAP